MPLERMIVKQVSLEQARSFWKKFMF